MKNIKFISLIGLAGMMLTSLSGCSSETDSNTLYLKVLNAGDYIYLNDPDNGYEEADLTEQYVEWINTPEIKEKYFGEGFDKEIGIIYDTYDTNETMFNELKTGKSTYDLVCSSDYMIQKMAKFKMIQEIDMNRVENYQNYASPFLIGENGKLAKVDIDPTNPELGTLNDFAIGYMWGTLGLMYNPSYKRIKNKTPEEVIEDFSSPNGWDVLWEEHEAYQSCASIKDSMRDTYAMGLVHTFSDEFKELYEEYQGNYNDEYNTKLSEIFNRHDNETIDKVQESLIELKDYIYGFEVDTGKSDIVTQKVGINLCWSGDAVYSMDTAEENDVLLYFAIPSYCCNIWFDAFSILSEVKDERLDAAYSFLDFISSPLIASENMDYVGYTPFIAGDDVFSLVEDWYEARDVDENDEYIETEGTIPYDLSYFFRTNEDDETEYVVYVEEDQINRQMRAQYPMEEDLPHLAIMQDFGETQNNKIVSMWEKVKVNPLPIWVVIIVVGGFVGLLSFFGSYKLIKKAKIRKRKKLREK